MNGIRGWLLVACAFAAVTSAPCRADHLDGNTLLEDAQLYFTAPLRWDSREWFYFGGALAAIGAAHEHDDEVRMHFTARMANPFQNKDPNSLRDAAPAAAVVAATWAYAKWLDDSAGYQEVGSMLEAGALSYTTATILKYGAGRLGPNETTHVDSWRKSGGSFPSGHSTLAFAIGTVLAESGGDGYRWIRRTLGQGMAAATAYARLDGNAHWLSDTVAGAALGIATAHFVMNRRERPDEDSAWNIAPATGGLMLTYSKVLRPRS